MKSPPDSNTKNYFSENLLGNVLDIFGNEESIVNNSKREKPRNNNGADSLIVRRDFSEDLAVEASNKSNRGRLSVLRLVKKKCFTRSPPSGTESDSDDDSIFDEESSNESTYEEQINDLIGSFDDTLSAVGSQFSGMESFVDSIVIGDDMKIGKRKRNTFSKDDNMHENHVSPLQLTSKSSQEQKDIETNKDRKKEYSFPCFETFSFPTRIEEYCLPERLIQHFYSSTKATKCEKSGLDVEAHKATSAPRLYPRVRFASSHQQFKQRIPVWANFGRKRDLFTTIQPENPGGILRNRRLFTESHSRNNRPVVKDDEPVQPSYERIRAAGSNAENESIEVNLNEFIESRRESRTHYASESKDPTPLLSTTSGILAVATTPNGKEQGEVPLKIAILDRFEESAYRSTAPTHDAKFPKENLNILNDLSCFEISNGDLLKCFLEKEEPAIVRTEAVTGRETVSPADETKGATVPRKSEPFLLALGGKVDSEGFPII